MRRLGVILSPHARGEIQEAAAWWKEHRPKAPGAIAQDVRRALEALRTSPTLGAPVRRTRVPGLRKHFLERVDYHLYYRVAEEDDKLVVLAFWHARRRPPVL
jgi:plasmid stabilization system protein ParE